MKTNPFVARIYHVLHIISKAETSYKFLVRSHPFNKQKDASGEAVHVLLKVSALVAFHAYVCALSVFIFAQHNILPLHQSQRKPEALQEAELVQPQELQ